MKYTVEQNISYFDAWSGGLDRWRCLMQSDECIIDMVDSFLDEWTDEESVDETAINDWLWFDMEDWLEENGIVDNSTGEYYERRDEDEEVE